SAGYTTRSCARAGSSRSGPSGSDTSVVLKRGSLLTGRSQTVGRRGKALDPHTGARSQPDRVSGAMDPAAGAAPLRHPVTIALHLLDPKLIAARHRARDHADEARLAHHFGAHDPHRDGAAFLRAAARPGGTG